MGATAASPDGRETAGPGRIRVAIATGLLLALPAAWLGVEMGGRVAIDHALADASALRDQHRFPEAIAVYSATATRSGPAYLLARDRIDQATSEAGQTILDWARSLAGAGLVDQALSVTLRVDDAALGESAQRLHAQIAFDAATSAQRDGHSGLALHRLDQLRDGNAPADLATEAARLRPAIELGAARELLASGHAAAAVAELDAAAAGGAAVAAEAALVLPDALLAAGRERAAAGDAQSARALLARLVQAGPGSAQAATARSLLVAPQPVTGTLVHGDGSPAGGVAVRLAGGFRRVRTTAFTVSGPYIQATTDAGGAFRLDGAPLNTPLVFEFRDGAGWELIEDQSRAPAYTVNVQSLEPVDLGFVRQP